MLEVPGSRIRYSRMGTISYIGRFSLFAVIDDIISIHLGCLSTFLSIAKEEIFQK